MFFFTLIVTLAASLPHQSLVAAAGCWRGTPCTGPSAASFPGPWDQYNYSPTSRTVNPVRILSSSNAPLSDFPGPSTLSGNGSLLVFDFGKEVAGIVTITYAAKGQGTLGLAFTEAKNWTGEYSDGTNGFYDFVSEGAIYGNVTSTAEANYTMPVDKLRGGFRYLSVFSVADFSDGAADKGQIELDIHDVSLELSYQPSWTNLRAYQGYFSSSDDLLNKIWYAGAYTLQTNAIPPNTGRRQVNPGWENDENLNLNTNGGTIYVDGSKRDRTVWAGDLTVALPSILISTGDLDGLKNTIQVLLNDQQSTGELPFAGPGLNIFGSDTYHMATLIGTYDYFLFTNDKDFLSGNWDRYKAGMKFITDKIDGSGLLNVTGTNDWGRRANQGAHNTEANMFLYQALTAGSALANWTGDAASASAWSSLAATLKTAVNKLNWDASVGAFKNSDTDASVHPEDGNSLALLFGVADSSKVQSISKQLTSNWGPIGAICPELPNNIVPYIEGFEIKGHLVARQATRALDLIRRSWGWYLNNPYGTESTIIEGYLADGTFGYRADDGYNNDYAYTSHAHGWSTGPTDALTSYIVGYTLTAPGGSEWQIAPQFADLTHAEGGFTTPLGKFAANWHTFDGGYNISWGAPGGTAGKLVLPGANGVAPTVVKDGQSMAKEAGEYDAAAQTLTIPFQADGQAHTVKVTY
ncbi:hypothetical protein LCER1_G008126 [Lachnellula cervina]|uniref:Uncharacterized protein n=1 Tax=Lachnellula cervina TaxID=1316786 RepID=A0A7D8YM97_9HELO|nr:hypothetical protein LCER1_G008126 [Lachnellula cervina]